jgi:tetratricopeptide (TPR) repeat protein
VEAIREPFRLLTTRLHNVPERHRSLAAVFEQTWTRLTDQERRVMMGLSIFRGGFTREAAEQVADADLEVLAMLQDKSLLGRGENGRHELHELIRQFAEAKLKLEPTWEQETLQRHSNFFARLLSTQSELLVDSRAREGLTLILADLENIRQAWNWLIANKAWSALEQAWEAIWLFFNYSNRFQEGKALFITLLNRIYSAIETIEQQRIKVIALSGTAWFSFMLGEVLESKEMIDQATMLSERVSLRDSHVLIWLLHTRISVLWALNEGEQALQQSHQAMKIANENTGKYYRAMAHFNLGLAFYRLNQHGIAREHLSQTVVICQSIGYTMGTAYAYAELGRAVEALGDYYEAGRLFEQSRNAFAQFEGNWGTANTLVYLGRVTNKIREHKEAASYLYQALDITQERNLLHVTAAALTEFAPLLASAGQPLLARSILEFLQVNSLGWPETQQRVAQYLGEIRQSVEDIALADEKQADRFTTVEEVVNFIFVNKSLLGLD